VEKAMSEAEKHGDRSELLAALVAEAREMIEQAKTQQAERARAAAEEVAAAAAVKAEAEAAEAAKRQQNLQELAALTLRVQEMQAQLGVPPVAQQDAEETQCVVCMDAAKDHLVLPCKHLCVCEACAQLLSDRCPVCRGPIEHITQVFT
jgi:hypothetical protein